MKTSLLKISAKLKISLFCLIVLILLVVPNATVSFAAHQLEVPLPGAPTSFSDPGAYIKYLFVFGLSLAGFLAVGAIIYGGIQYMGAGTSITSTQKGKDAIKGAITGLAILLCSYLILTTIDPSLTNLTPSIPPLGNVAAPPPEPERPPDIPLNGAPYNAPPQSNREACVAFCEPNPSSFTPSTGNCTCTMILPLHAPAKTCYCYGGTCYETRNDCPLYATSCIMQLVSTDTVCKTKDN